MKTTLMTHVRQYFIPGLLVWVPIWITLLVIGFLVGIMDSSLALLPAAYHPDVLLGFHVPGLGVLLSLVVVLATGFLATNLFGNKIVILWEKLVRRIPLVRSIYLSVKQVMETILASNGASFRKVFLVEYPRKGVWSIGLQTGVALREAREQITDDLITLFIPTTPNPTSGFIIFVSRRELRELHMSVDEALRMIISLGVAHPIEKKETSCEPIIVDK